jgi:hypothetical protein
MEPFNEFASIINDLIEKDEEKLLRMWHIFNRFPKKVKEMYDNYYLNYVIKP